MAKWLKLYVTYTISTYQILLKLVKIWRSSNKNKNVQFFWHTV